MTRNKIISIIAGIGITATAAIGIIILDEPSCKRDEQSLIIEEQLLCFSDAEYAEMQTQLKQAVMDNKNEQNFYYLHIALSERHDDYFNYIRKPILERANNASEETPFNINDLALYVYVLDKSIQDQEGGLSLSNVEGSGAIEKLNQSILNTYK